MSGMNKLTKALTKLTVASAPQKKKKRNRRKRGNKSTPGTQGVVSKVPVGTILFSRLEYVTDVKSTNSFDLCPATFPFLKNLASSFEQYRWLSVKIIYKPMVGSTTSGAVTIGVDWSNKAAKNNRADVASLTPMFDCPVWQVGNMVLPVSRLNTRKEYILDSDDINDRQPCKIFWSTTSTTVVGDLWVEYSIRMFGTK